MTELTEVFNEQGEVSELHWGDGRYEIIGTALWATGRIRHRATKNYNVEGKYTGVTVECRGNSGSRGHSFLPRDKQVVTCQKCDWEARGRELSTLQQARVDDYKAGQAERAKAEEAKAVEVVEVVEEPTTVWQYGTAFLGMGGTRHLASRPVRNGEPYNPNVHCSAGNRGQGMTVRSATVHSFRVVEDREVLRDRITCLSCLKTPYLAVSAPVVEEIQPESQSEQVNYTGPYQLSLI